MSLVIKEVYVMGSATVSVNKFQTRDSIDVVMKELSINVDSTDYSYIDRFRFHRSLYALKEVVDNYDKTYGSTGGKWSDYSDDLFIKYRNICSSLDFTFGFTCFLLGLLMFLLLGEMV